MSLLSDSLLAITGLKPKHIGPKDVADAALLPGKWQKKIRAWLTAEQAPFNYVPIPEDIDKWLDELVKPIPDEDVARWIEETGDPALVTEYVIGLKRARDYLVAVWPRVIEDTFAGPKPYPLSEDDAAEMWSLIGGVDDPDRMLDKVADYSLTAAEVSALKGQTIANVPLPGCYPDLYAFLAGSPVADGAIQQAIMEQVAKDPDWEPTAEQDAVLRTLLGLPPEIPLAPPPPKPAPPKKFEVEPEMAATQVDLTATPKLAGRKR